jgi:L-asparagine transporter-like permease
VAFMEKSNWVILAVGITTLVAYLALIVPPAVTGPIADVSYAQPMVGAIVAFIALCILGMIVAAALNPSEADKKDQRDKEIDHLGERIGNSFIALGFAAALILTLVEADYFWIANFLYLTGMAAGLLSALVKIAAYHGPFQRW